MAPTEETILTSFLLTRAMLPSITTLNAFMDMFPRSVRSSQKVQQLYRDLQLQRARIVDQVANEIAAEVKRGITQRQVVARVRRAGRSEEQDDEVEIESALFGQVSNLPEWKPHSLTSILPELEAGVEDLEDEIRRLEEEADTILQEMQSTVEGLSDLRYGTFSNGQIRQQVLEGIQRLENV